MRFLHLVQRYAPAIGGSEWYMRRLSEELVSRGHQVKVFTTDAIEVDAIWRRDAKHIACGREVINNVELIRLPVQYLPFHGKTMTLLSFLPVAQARYRFSMPGPLLPDFDEISKAAGEFDMVHATALPFTSIFWVASKLVSYRKKPLRYYIFRMAMETVLST